MSHLKYTTYPGFGEYAQAQLRFSQAVRIGSRIEVSGQTGKDPLSSPQDPVSDSIIAQIEQAFENVALALNHADGASWSQVYRVNSYHVGMNDEHLGAMVQAFKKWMPDHQPIWTAVGVAGLADEKFKVEIEVVAHDGAKDTQQ